MGIVVEIHEGDDWGEKMSEFFNEYLLDLAEKSQEELSKHKAIKDIKYENGETVVERGEYNTEIKDESDEQRVVVEIVPKFNNIIDERSNSVHIDKAGFEGTRRMLKLVNKIKRNGL